MGGGGVTQKRESSDLSFPEVGISAASVVHWLMACKVAMDIMLQLIFYLR